MERWAQGPLGDTGVDFYCVCVDDIEVATSFSRMFKFMKVVNCWIPSQDAMPSYGQLGCSGFIIIGTKGECVSRATEAMLRVGPERAFRSAELLMRKALPTVSKAPAELEGYEFCAGSLVRIDGLLQKPELNGLIVSIVTFDTKSGRYLVEFQDSPLVGKRILLRPCSIAPLDTASEASSSGETHCSGGNCALDLTSTVGTSDPSTTGDVVFLEAPVLVGHEAVDEEHVHCTAAINRLLQAAVSPEGASAVVFQDVLDSLNAHFQHEESIVENEQARFSTTHNKNASLSGFDGHKADHKRMIGLAIAGRDHVNNGRSHSLENAKLLAQAFAQHVEVYDVLLEQLMKEPA